VASRRGDVKKSMTQMVQAAALSAQCAAMLRAAGSSAAEAEQVAANWVMANLSRLRRKAAASWR
jgi:LDH2 family malate/lactate/ureidoglycolate dehydrogenase